MKSVFLREEKYYSQKYLAKELDLTKEKTVHMLNLLKKYGVVKANNTPKDHNNFVCEDIEVVNVELGTIGYEYKFTFVGVIIIEGRMLKCYPKYLPIDEYEENEENQVLNQVLKVIRKYKYKKQIIPMYNNTTDNTTFDRVGIMLFLLDDYYEYGVYTNTQDIIESNGTGEILWDKTINETVTLLSNNRPYYPELLTMKRVNDDLDFFKRLHECILTLCTKELQDNHLLELFDIIGVNISDQLVEEFGDTEYILERIVKELNVQFNTRKQILLKTLYAYIKKTSALYDSDYFSMYGTNNFNLVWEDVCSKVIGNHLKNLICSLPLPVQLHQNYHEYENSKLEDLICKPKWEGTQDGEKFYKRAKHTLIPDIILIVNHEEKCQFIILDAKYYNMQLEKNKKLDDQPKIESITKQYLYQLAYKSFIKDHKIKTVKNCFLMPTSSDEFIKKGTVSLDMMSGLDLQNIQIQLLPARKMYQHYMDNTKIDISELRL